MAEVVALSLPASWASRIKSPIPASTIGLRPDASVSTLNGLISTPVTVCPRRARHAAVTAPTYPSPKMLIDRLIQISLYAENDTLIEAILLPKPRKLGLLF